MKPIAARANSHSLADAAYEAIRGAILRCELAPGAHVTESGLGGSFGFGRAAVRAALTRLGQERLVQVIPRHGYAIAPITFKQVHDLFGVRLVLEPAAARLAAERVDPVLVAHLEQLNEACAHRTEHDDPATLRQANRAFHVAIAHATGNDRLEEMTRVTLEELDRVLYLPQLVNVWERIDATYDEHRRIIAAICARDPEAAEQAASEHIVPNKRFVIDVLTSSPGLRSVNLVGI